MGCSASLNGRRAASTGDDYTAHPHTLLGLLNATTVAAIATHSNRSQADQTARLCEIQYVIATTLVKLLLEV